MNENPPFTPFDIKCFSKLEEKFAFLFEPALINEICFHGRNQSFNAQDVVIDIGSSITHMPLVIEGSIKVMTEDEEGEDLLLYYLELGETCAITLNCCTKQSKSAIKAIAETNSDLLFIPVNLMEEWMVKYPSWRRFVLDSYNQRFNEMLKALDTIVFGSLEERIKKLLTEKAWIAKSKSIDISHSDIANDLHSSRVAISRIMKKLESDGFLTQRRNKVELASL